MVLVGGRLHALAHGVRQKVAHLGVVAGTAVWSVDVAEGTLLDAGGQWCGKAASLALGDGGAVGGASGSGGDLILEGCCVAPLAVVPGRAAPLGVEIDAVVVRVPSYAIPVRKGCHLQRRRHLHARCLVFELVTALIERPRILG